jgi:muramidase (phage lysozyme)
MNKINYDEVIKNSNMRHFLSVIAQAEGTGGKDGYYTLVGGQKIYDLSKHPNQVGLVTKSGKSTAFGRYQTLYTTYTDVAPKLGIKDMSPNSQDKIAAYLINRSGALENVLKGDFVGAIKKLGGVWASLPSSQYKGEQSSKDWDTINKYLGSNLGEPNPNHDTSYQNLSASSIIANNMGVFIPDETTDDKKNNKNNLLSNADDKDNLLSNALEWNGVTQVDLTPPTMYDVNKTPEELALGNKTPGELTLGNNYKGVDIG